MNSTVAYYERNAERYCIETVHANMSALYKPFIELIPPNGKILDAGCGSGRDSLYFIQHGYRIEAFDASLAMCSLASNLIGQPVQHRTFNEIEWVSEFDGIWACASLLHVGRGSIDDVLDRLCRALKPNGTMFMSFKLRDGEWEQEGRFFNGYTQGSFRKLIDSHRKLRTASIWTSADARISRRGEEWLNALLQRADSRVLTRA